MKPPYRIRVLTVLHMLLVVACLTPIHAGGLNGENPFQSFQTVKLDEPHPLFEDIQSRIRNVSIFRAEFTEEKDLNALSRTIKNSGFVLFSRNRGLYRHVRKPFDTRQLITKDGLVVEQTPQETRRKNLKPGSAPRQFLDSLYMVFSGNFSKFKERFRIELKIRKLRKEDRPMVWTLRVHPADQSMKSFFSRMLIRGKGKFLTSFTLKRDNGDTTRTRFQNQTYPEELNEQQVHFFRSMREK